MDGIQVAAVMAAADDVLTRRDDRGGVVDRG